MSLYFETCNTYILIIISIIIRYNLCSLITDENENRDYEIKILKEKIDIIGHKIAFLEGKIEKLENENKKPYKVENCQFNEKTKISF